MCDGDAGWLVCLLPFSVSFHMGECEPPGLVRLTGIEVERSRKRRGDYCR